MEPSVTMSLTGAGVTAMLAAVQCSLNEAATTGPCCLLLPPSPHWPLPGFSDMRVTPPHYSSALARCWEISPGMPPRSAIEGIQAES